MESIPAADTITGLIQIFNEAENFAARGSCYCPKCGDTRAFDVQAENVSDLGRYSISNRQLIVSHMNRAVLIYTCRNCNMLASGFIYISNKIYKLAFFTAIPGGISSPNSPEGVSYYLDQAQLCVSVGANSAAVSMYRGALEQLLFEQGYKTGMLGAKVGKLVADIATNTAPKWAMEIEHEFLDVIKELGNGAIHPNDGDITAQAKLDSSVLQALNSTFRHLLFTIYEVQHLKKKSLDSLKAGIIRK